MKIVIVDGSGLIGAKLVKTRDGLIIPPEYHHFGSLPWIIDPLMYDFNSIKMWLRTTPQ